MTRRALVGLVFAVGVVGCVTTGRTTLGPGPRADAPAPPVAVVTEERTVAVPLGDERTAQLGAQLVRPERGRGPAVIIVPGAGDISREGLRPGDGTSSYARPVPVSTLWADGLAARGALVLSYDKRTCGPNDDARCAKNPQDDVDAEGPIALARDVDAACALVRAEPSFDGRIVLLAHGQAAQVALSSSCARDAVAVVLVAPIPRAVDEVIVAGLRERTQALDKQLRAEKDSARKAALAEEASQLRNLAGTREAEFASMKAGRFAPTARISGATLAFWRGWMDVTSRTAALAEAVPAQKIVVLGELDRQYAVADRTRIRALATAGVVDVRGADHHLLTAEALAPATLDAVGAALDAVLERAPRS